MLQGMVRARLRLQQLDEAPLELAGTGACLHGDVRLKLRGAEATGKLVGMFSPDLVESGFGVLEVQSTKQPDVNILWRERRASSESSSAAPASSVAPPSLEAPADLPAGPDASDASPSPL